MSLIKISKRQIDTIKILFFLYEISSHDSIIYVLSNQFLATFGHCQTDAVMIFHRKAVCIKFFTNFQHSLIECNHLFRDFLSTQNFIMAF